jgi:hypothetical protein
MPTRTAIAALTATNLDDVYLTEAGREGKFVFSTANLSAMVTADTAQGIYIAPSSDTTGASGAWVRKFDGPVNVRWFGTAADGTTNDGAAFTAALALLLVNSTSTAFGYGTKGLQSLFVPAGHYYLGTSTLDITATVMIEGEGAGFLGGPQRFFGGQRPQPAFARREP